MTTPKQILEAAASVALDRLSNGRIVTKRGQDGEEYTEHVPATAAEITAALKVYAVMQQDIVVPTDTMGLLEKKLEQMGNGKSRIDLSLVDADEEAV
jgi:hypothetical protein